MEEDRAASAQAQADFIASQYSLEEEDWNSFCADLELTAGDYF